jgi:phosphoserine phosphatase|tara:strand:- start:116 stop:481 length:366 start_codon:yes stop_codon:yes gene_type:complete
MKTIICDIDGTIFKYRQNVSVAAVFQNAESLPGVVKKFNEWEAAGHKIILITGRRESIREITEKTLIENGIPFDMLIMGCADTGRILINDINFVGKTKAHAVNLERDAGFEDYDWNVCELE